MGKQPVDLTFNEEVGNAHQESNPLLPLRTVLCSKCSQSFQTYQEMLKHRRVHSEALVDYSFKNFPHPNGYEEQHFIHHQEQSEMLTYFDDKQPVDLTFNEGVGNGKARVRRPATTAITTSFASTFGPSFSTQVEKPLVPLIALPISTSSVPPSKPRFAQTFTMQIETPFAAQSASTFRPLVLTQVSTQAAPTIAPTNKKRINTSTVTSSMELQKKNIIKKNSRKHLKKKTLYMCDKCHYKTDDNSNFKKHSVTHSKLKPFQCDACGKGFSRKDHLKNHQRSTAASSDFKFGEKCFQCDQRFDHRCQLLKHMKAEHQKSRQRFTCLQCGKIFTRKENLKEHSKMVCCSK